MEVSIIKDAITKVEELAKAAVQVRDVGGMWKIEARRNIAGYLEDELKELVENGTVVI